MSIDYDTGTALFFFRRRGGSKTRPQRNGFRRGLIRPVSGCKAVLLFLAVALLLPPFSRAEDPFNVDLPLWKRNGRSAAARSLVAPGWGQFYNRQRTKGGTLFVLAVGGAAGALVMAKRSRGSYEEYKFQGDPSGGAYNRYSRQRNLAFVSGGASLVFWALSVWDAYDEGERLGRLFNEANSRRFDIALAPGGASARWRFGGGDSHENE